MRRLFFKKLKNKNEGVALITALLVVSLATIMAVALTSRQYIDIRRTGNMMQSDQAYLDAIASETFVGQLLANLRSSGVSKFDNISDFDTALLGLSSNMSSEERIVTVQAAYPESLFNVNTLVDKNDKPDEDQQEIYRRLLKSVLEDVGGDVGQVDSLISSLIDWIDENEESRIDGAEDSNYEGKDPPYKAANRMLSSISELRLIEGYTDELLDGIPADEENEIEAIPGLLMYVAALPDRDTTLNINFMSRKLIRSLSAYMEESMIDELINGQPYESVGEFEKNPTLDSIKTSDPANWKKLIKEIENADLEMQSSYFVIKSSVTVGKTTVNLNSLIYVNTSGQKLEVVSRAIGTDGI